MFLDKFMHTSYLVVEYFHRTLMCTYTSNLDVILKKNDVIFISVFFIMTSNVIRTLFAWNGSFIVDTVPLCFGMSF